MVGSSSDIPTPVPNLTKKARGRRVPTLSTLGDGGREDNGASKEIQAKSGGTARIHACVADGCGKCFTRKEHLDRHVISLHTDEKREVYFSMH